MNHRFIETEHNSKGAIKMWQDETVIAELTFSRINEHNVIVDHTEVKPVAQGTGAGKSIIEHFVKWARTNNQKVLPLCPFAKSIINKNESYHDILRK
ncbi:MAG: GNAT family N-acetyltransferase [Salibacteraceae bacterium]